MGDWLFRAIVSIIQLASYWNFWQYCKYYIILITTTVQQRYSSTLCTTWHEVHIAEATGAYYLFSSCPAPFHNILFISLGMGEQLPVCACALVLSQLAGPLLVALPFPWDHAYQVASIWKLKGRNLVPITTSVPLNASHPEHVHAELQISEGENTQQNCGSGFWINLSPYMLTD